MMVLLLLACGPPLPRNETLERTIFSEPLDTEYALRIYLPPEAEGAEALPWLLVLDGQWLVHEAAASDQMIVEGLVAPHALVGIGNDDTRGRDYAPRRPEDEEPIGLEDYVAWLQSTLIPELEAEFNLGGSPELRGLTGHSLGGQATCVALFEHQDIWSRFAASSPSLWLYDGHAFGLEEAWAAQHEDLPARLSMTIGEIEASPMNALFDALAERLEGRGYPSLEMQRAVIPGETHFTVDWPAYDASLPFLFPPEGAE